MATQLVTIPVVTTNLGVDGYSVFAVAMSLLVWYLLVDLGLSVGLHNVVAEARARGEDPADYIGAGFWLGVAICLVALILVFGFAAQIANYLFEQSPSVDSAGATTIVQFTGVLWTMCSLGNIGYRVLLAQGRPQVAHVASAAAGGASLLLLVGVLPNTQDNQIVIALACSIVPIAGAQLGLFLLGLYSAQNFRRKPTLGKCCYLLRRSFWFWVYSILLAASTNSDVLVIVRVLSPTDIALYSILAKVLLVANTLYLLVLQNVSRYFTTLAIQKNETALTSLVLTFSLSGMTGMAIFWLCIFLAAPWALGVLFPEASLEIDSLTIAIFGSLGIVRIWVDTYTAVLNSQSRVKSFLPFLLAQGGLSIAAQFYLGSILGLRGIAAGMLLSMMLFTAWGLPALFWRAPIELKYIEDHPTSPERK